MGSSGRIRRMEEDGILTPSQASMLRESLAAGGADRTSQMETPRRRWSKGWMIGVAGLSAVLVLLILIPGAGIDDTVVQDVASTMNQPGGHGQMNKTFSAVLAVAILLVVPLLGWMWFHNSLVSKEEKVFAAWAQTESNFQRRADLIPQLVDTVSRYLKHESETLIGVVKERGDATKSLSGAVDDLIRAEKASTDLLRGRAGEVIGQDTELKALYEAQQKVGRSITALMGLAESYPDLRASDQFQQLQAQIEGTENRINVARIRFNNAVKDYNGAIRQLPGALVAQVGDFRRKAYFQSEEEAKSAPVLEFK